MSESNQRPPQGSEPAYVPAWISTAAATDGLGAAAEVFVQNGPLRDAVSPVLYNHVGNVWVGGSSAILTLVAARVAAVRANDQGEIVTTTPPEKLQAHRTRTAAAAATIALALNLTTETKWGVSHLPVAEWFNGKTPDAMDAAVSSAVAGLAGYLGWRRKPFNGVARLRKLLSK